MVKCECGNGVYYDGYNNIEIEDGFIVIKGQAKCSVCEKIYNYEELHNYDENNPFDVILENIK